MPLHKLLQRQLSKLGLSLEKPPDELSWKDLLLHINNTYEEGDQERYLLERSMVISSQEHLDLIKKIESAQTIAHLGYWYHDIERQENSWSRELRNMLGLPTSEKAPALEDALKLVHEEDRDQLVSLINDALNYGKDYEIEMRLRQVNPNSEYKWYKVLGHVETNAQGKATKLLGIAMDIHQSKIADIELQELNKKLIVYAKRAGMSEVATSVLHNIGNVLNSANVAVEILKKVNASIYFDKLLKTCSTIKVLQQNDELEPDKLNLMLNYIEELMKRIKILNYDAEEEINNLKKHLDHIKAITSIQENLSGVPGVAEEIKVASIINNAITMSGNNYNRSGIKVVKNLGNETINTDQNKLLQIIVNLLHNAKDALLESDNPDKTITITSYTKGDMINLEFKDNGIGILAEHMPVLFSFGFTTKKTGHGYGLQNSSLFAKEMGGKLHVVSEGKNKGSIFTLTLPMRAPVKNKRQESQYEDTNHR